MFRFTIRDVLWLTVVVAMGLAMLPNHMAWARYHHESTKSIRQVNRDLTDGALELEHKYLELLVKQPRTGGPTDNRP
jgi:hypothetical protein